MLPLPDFSLHRPDRLDDALGLLAADGVRVIAGGTDLLPSMKHRLFTPDALVSLGALPGLSDVVETADGGLRIGARATLRAIRRHPFVGEHYPGLRDACATVATSTIQAMATLGGNVMLDTRCLYYNQPAGWRASIGGCLKADGEVCHVAPKGRGCYAAQSSDTVPALILYEAELELHSAAGGMRTLALADLFAPAEPDGHHDGRDWLRIRPDELLTAIVLPPPGSAVCHRKVRARGAIDYGLLLVAVQRHGKGGRAVVGAVGPGPIVVEADHIHDLPEAAWKAAMPLSTHAWASTWRKHMVRVEVKRAIAELGVPHLASK